MKLELLEAFKNTINCGFCVIKKDLPKMQDSREIRKRRSRNKK